jgi:hypothetical protein
MADSKYSRAREVHGADVERMWRKWHSMLGRCHDPKNSSYALYGGRGITVCDRWRESFSDFACDMGPIPAGMSLDRIDNDGPYSPENCRWADRKTQGRNRRTNRLITAHGKTASIVEWSEITGLTLDTLQTRVRRGWPDEDIVSRPSRPYRNRSYICPQQPSK